MGDGTALNQTAPISISTAGYEWKVGTPTFSVAGGTYSATQSVVVTEATAGAEIHYTTTGADPTATDPQVASSGTLSVTQSQILKAVNLKSGRR